MAILSMVFESNLPRIPTTMVQICKHQFPYRPHFFEPVITDAEVGTTIDRLIHPAVLM